MVNDQLGIIVQTILDTSGIDKSEFDKIQKIAEKYKINITANMDKKQLVESVKSVLPSIITEINKQYSLNIPIDIDDKMLTKTVNQYQSEIEKLNAKANKVKFSLDNGHGASEYQNRINSVIASLERYGIETKEVQNITASLQSTLDSMKGLSGQELVTQADKLEQEFKAVKISVDEARLSYDKLMQPASKEKISSTLLKVQKLLSNNTKITEEVKQEWQSYVNRLSSGSNIAEKEIKDINIRLKETESQMRGMGRLGFSWTDKLKQAWGKFGGWGFATGTMMTLVNQLRRIPEEVIKVDSAIVELRKVSDASDNEIKNYFDEAAESAKDLGSSISDIISSTADFSRLGYNLSDASELAKVATLYKNVGDGINIDQASSSIVSTMKAFGIEAENAIDIVDKFNEVGNNFAISSGDIGDALSRSASSLAVAGNSLSESIGLITAGNTIVQDADTVGTALKTLSLRITSTTAELEAMGEDTEFACETLSDYRDLVLGLTGNKVNIIGDNGEYKSTYQILKEISNVWEDMNSMEQSSLMKALFGVRQANIGASILENFDVAEEAMKSAEGAAGSALKEQENYEKGVQYSLDRLEASYQEFANHILDSDLIKGIVDFGNTAINVIDAVTNKLGSLGTIGLGAGIFAGFKNAGREKCYPSYHICL